MPKRTVRKRTRRVVRSRPNRVAHKRMYYVRAAFTPGTLPAESTFQQLVDAALTNLPITTATQVALPSLGTWMVR